MFGWHSSNTTEWVGGTNGSEYGGVVAGGSQGYLGKGTEFDGVDDVIGDWDIEPISYVTMNAWIKHNIETSGTNTIARKGATDGYITRIENDGIPSFFITTNSGAWNSIKSTSVIENNTWYMITGIYNGTKKMIYINGILNASSSQTGTIDYDAFNLRIGCANNPCLSEEFNGTIDEVMIWERALNSSDVLRLYNEQVGSKINDVELINNTESISTLSSGNTTKGNVWRNEVCIGNPEVNDCFTSNNLEILNSPPTTPTTLAPPTGIYTTNYTTNLTCSGSTDPDGDTINYEFYYNHITNPPTSIVQNSTLTNYGGNFTSYGDGYYWWRCRANDGSAVSSYTTARSILVDWREIIYYKPHYVGSVLEGTISYFEGNISINPQTVSSLISATLNYNNTNYVAEISAINSTYYKTYITVTAPKVNTNPESKTFYWSYNYELINETSKSNTTASNTQSIYQLQLFNCTDNSVNATQVLVFNYTFWDEKEGDGITGKDLNSSFDATYTLWSGDPSISRSISFDITNKSNVGICVTPKNQTFTTDATIEYVQLSGYDTRWYYYQQYPTINTTHNVNLFLLPQYYAGNLLAENIEFTVLDSAGAPLPDYLIYVDKYFTGINEYKTVAMGKTDGFGKSHIYLDKLLTEYRIRVEYNNINYYTGVTGIIGTTTYPEIRIGVTTQSDILNIIDNVGTSLTYDNSTKIITAVYNYSGSELVNVTLDVYERRPENDTWICSTTYYNTQSGIINCYYGNNTGGRYIATLSVGSGGSTKAVNNLEINLVSTLLKDRMGSDGLWITALMVLTLFFVGLWKPEVSIVFGVLGLFISWIIGFIYLSWGVVIALVILTVLLIIRGSR